jgi:exopolyphosphatase / guanosine-5'-triphosphate,3'-diphosphate pyrophosphatase
VRLLGGGFGNGLVAGGRQRLSERRVLTVQLPALHLETANEPIEVGRQPEVRCAGRSLHRTHPGDQHFQVVHAAEEILRRFQSPHARRRARSAQLVHQLEGVPQLLDRDTNFVQAVGQIEAGCGIHRGAKTHCPSGRAIACGRQPLPMRGAGTNGAPLAGRGQRTASQLVHIDARHLARHVRVAALALRIQHLFERADSGPRDLPGKAGVVEGLKHNVELARGPERLREPAHPARELATARSGRHERQHLTQPPRRNPRLVHQVAVPVDRAGKRSREHADALTDDLFRGCTAMTHVTPYYIVTSWMHIAAIDIGTNSIHMIVVRVRADLSFEIVDREKAMVRLGAGGLDGRNLTAEAMDAALQALSTFKRLADAHRVDKIVAVATSATREAHNGGEFLARIERVTGVRPRVITAADEARLIHRAAVYGVDVGGGRAAVIDIGGGSVEITLGTATSLQLARSFKLGVIRLTERFVKADPLSNADERRLERHILDEVGRYCDQIVAIGFDRVVGTSGTILSLGAMAATAEHGAPPRELRNLRIAARQIRGLRKEVRRRNLESRLRMPGLDPRRADLVVAGAVLFDTLLRRLQADEVTLCDLALREGLVLDYIRRHRRQIARVDAIPDVRRRSTIELAERCNYAAVHAEQVARLALALFDQTRSVHDLTDRERVWLEYAALMHDLGAHISYSRHHRHSYYLIKNGDLRGFEPHEVEVIALVARYHRRGTPKRTHDEYARLPAALRQTVRTLAAILRVAESLDRSHGQVVAGLELQDRRDDAVLRLQTTGDAELEMWATARHVGPLERLLRKPVRLAAAPAVAATAS